MCCILKKSFNSFCSVTRWIISLKNYFNITKTISISRLTSDTVTNKKAPCISVLNDLQGAYFEENKHFIHFCSVSSFSLTTVLTHFIYLNVFSMRSSNIPFAKGSMFQPYVIISNLFVFFCQKICLSLGGLKKHMRKHSQQVSNESDVQLGKWLAMSREW